MSTCGLALPKMQPTSSLRCMANSNRFIFTSSPSIGATEVTTAAAGLLDHLHQLRDVRAARRCRRTGSPCRPSAPLVSSLDQEEGLLVARRGVRRAELQDLLALPLDRLDDDDVLRARERGALDGGRADAADAVDDDGLAGLHVGGVDRRAPAGRHAAADQRGLLAAGSPGRSSRSDSTDTTVYGAEGAQRDHRAEVLAVLAVVAGGLVGELAAAEQERAEVAQLRLALAARRALAAARDEAEDDVVADGEVGDALARPPMTSPAPSWPPMTGNCDMPMSSAMSGGSAMSPVTRCSSEWHRPRGGQLDEDLARLRRVELDVLDAPVGVRLPQDGGARLHRLSVKVERVLVLALQRIRKVRALSAAGWSRSGLAGLTRPPRRSVGSGGHDGGDPTR